MGLALSSSHSGARTKVREPEIHNQEREYGFRVCAFQARPGMTEYGRSALALAERLATVNSESTA